MKRVLTLAVIGLLIGCGGNEKQSPPVNADSRRSTLHAKIENDTPWKVVKWESVLKDVAVTRVSLREDSLFLECIELTGKRQGMAALYRLNAATGNVDWIVDLPAQLDFPPGIVGSIVKSLAQLEAERKALVQQRGIEQTRKDKNMEKIQQLTDEIKRRNELLESNKRQDRVYAVSQKDQLHVIERQAGAEFERVRLAFTPSTAAVASPSVVFLGALDRDRLIGLDPRNWAEIMYFPADGDIVTTPIFAEPGNVYFASKDGHVYGYTADGKTQLLDYKTESEIVADMCLDIEVKDGRETWGGLLVGSTDYALYCFNRVTGELYWKYETGGQIRNEPQVSGQVAYCYSRGKGMHAIDKKTGKLLYIKNDTYYVICRGKDRVFLGGPKGSVVAVEERTGKELAKYDTSEFQWVVKNPNSNTTYLVTEDGFAFAAKESNIDY